MEILSEVRSVIALDQPGLVATLGESGVTVGGEYALMPVSQEFIGYGPITKYSVEIEFPETFPAVEPRLHEVGGAIPKNSDHHVNADGTCCIGVWEAITSVDKPITVQEYFDGPFRDYFLGQYCKAKTGKWLLGELSHGRPGLIEAFAEKFSCEPAEERVLSFLRTLSKNGLKGHWNCPCGSGNIIRKCCTLEMAELRKQVSKEDAQRMLHCL